MLNAERRIAEIQAEYLARAVAVWRGYERVLLVELVRGLDEAAFALTMAPNRGQLIQEDAARHAIILGAASALRPFLEVIRDDPGGVPWAPTSPKLSSIADQHLLNCGNLAAIQRLAAFEQYGLAEATFQADDHLILEVESDDEERAEVRSGAWLNAQVRKKLAAAEARMAAMKNQVAANIDRYTGVHDGWFIRYDPDWEMIEYHRDYAAIYSAGTAEADALPRTALLGGRSFAEWNESSATALGRVFHHIACAARLKATNQDLELRNLLTVFARKDDIDAVWREVGETREWAERIVKGMTLDAATAIAAERDFEIPLPYYVDFGRDFVLLPAFGGLMNPSAGLVWHLRREYRSDWDRAVDGREHMFRRDLRALFPEPRYVVPERGIRLKRDDGTDLTDVDAVVLDKHTGSLVLVQLKWPDIYGRSLTERNSRRLNLLKANEWVSRVHDWIAGRSAGEIAKAVGLGPAGARSPWIVVIARHTAQFVNEVEYDQRAQWISWPRLVQLCTQSPEHDIFSLLADRDQELSDHRRHNGSDFATNPVTYYQLPGLTVEVRLS